jgi:hypothetical protein
VFSKRNQTEPSLREVQSWHSQNWLARALPASVMSKESSQAMEKPRAKLEESEVAGVEVVVTRVDGREGEMLHWQRDGGGQDRDH